MVSLSNISDQNPKEFLSESVKNEFNRYNKFKSLIEFLKVDLDIIDTGQLNSYLNLFNKQNLNLLGAYELLLHSSNFIFKFPISYSSVEKILDFVDTLATILRIEDDQNIEPAKKLKYTMKKYSQRISRQVEIVNLFKNLFTNGIYNQVTKV